MSVAKQGPKCFLCGGTGRVSTTDGPICSSCDGKGYIELPEDYGHLPSLKPNVRGMEYPSQRDIERLEREKALLHEHVEAQDKILNSSHGIVLVPQDELDRLRDIEKDVDSGFAPGAYARLKELQAKERSYDELKERVEELEKRPQYVATKFPIDAYCWEDSGKMVVLKADWDSLIDKAAMTAKEYESLKAEAVNADKFRDLLDEVHNAGGSTGNQMELREWLQSLKADAELGALVRKMPNAALFHNYGKWRIGEGWQNVPEYDTPEEALRSILGPS